MLYGIGLLELYTARDDDDEDKSPSLDLLNTILFMKTLVIYVFALLFVVKYYPLDGNNFNILGDFT